MKNPRVVRKDRRVFRQYLNLSDRRTYKPWWWLFFLPILRTVKTEKGRQN